jgi:hypothetical protein
VSVAALTLDERITRRLRATDYTGWRAKVEATGGCLHPIHLTGRSEIQDLSGTALTGRSGHIFAPCGNRRASVCPACSDRYAADAFHLVRAGLAGGTKGIPAEVAGKPRFFVTLTAPSFGPVHNRRISRRGRVQPCACGGYHHDADPRIGTPLDPESYDYVGAVLWQAHAGELWHRFTIALRRQLAYAAGISERAFRDQARLSYAKVAEYQRRALIHFHAVIRIDGPTGPDDATPGWVTADLLEHAIRAAVRSVVVPATRPDGAPVELGWGEQVDTRRIRPDQAHQVENEHGEISEQRLAGYVAKYATKGTGKTEAADRPIRSQRDIDHLVVADHHRRMIQICWDLGGLPGYERLNLRKWAHMLGFRGHFLTKSKYYSTTFKVIREERRAFRRRQTLDELETQGVDLDCVVVVNHWQFTGIGYADQAERELAAAIGERKRQQRQRTHEQEGAA